MTSLNHDQGAKLPKYDSRKTLANRFSTFFVQKIIKIRQRLTNNTQNADEIPTIEPTSILSAFKPAIEDEVRKAIFKSKSKSRSQDPIPTTLLKDCVNALLPVRTKIINLSLNTGVMPANLKKAHILPLLKKAILDLEILKNYRPLSNLHIFQNWLKK